MSKDIRVERMNGKVHVYDRLGSGSLELDYDEARGVMQQLAKILEQ